MNFSLAHAAFWLAAALAALMGFAIQRGATCMVAAVDEVVSERRFRRLGAMALAALWVLGGLVVAQALGVLPQMPVGYPVTALTVAGGVLLGLGAFVGRACVFGAVARFGSGDWAYLAVPLGFFAGCATFGPVLRAMAPSALPDPAPVLAAGSWRTVPLAIIALAIVVRALRHPSSAPRSAVRAAWTPANATTVIGIAFLLLLLLVGPWAYTDALAELARRMAHDLPARGLLFVALLGGAALGGWTAGRLRIVRPTPGHLARCFASGLLMGWGSLLIPGGNDGLILVGMPLLWPYAWLAMASMALAIGLALVAARRVAATARSGA